MDDLRTKELTENLISKINYYYPKDEQTIIEALKFASAAHEGQLRASGSPYISHPIQVADILIDLGLDSATICAALLHDTLEDTEVTDAMLREKFGDTIGDLVQGLTKLAKIHFDTIEQEQAENIRKMFFAMAKDIRVLIIKLADRLHNMRSLSYLSKDRQLAMARETIELYAPLAGRLGISPIKCELEDLCLKYLDNPMYEYLSKNIAQTKVERQEMVDAILIELREIVKDAEIPDAEISGRTKHFYSIYKKMKNQHKTLDQIYDLTAVRIIVDSVKDCFTVLGSIHAKWKPIPGRFKDYIAVPKPNRYQSLHTTVITNFGVPIEIQIRTYEMHKIAEYGIAAHWKYKEGVTGDTPLDDKLQWIKEFLAYEPDVNSHEFLDIIKKDISISNEIYVFTPKGDVRALKAGSSALDFAYAIHSEVGNHCVGVKVNSKIVPLATTLITGDVVEVLINQSSKGPSRDWLKIVKTSSAKVKIRQFFKRELKDEYIKAGKQMLEKEAKHKNLTLSQLLTDEAVKAVCDRYMYNNLEEMYASVGYGGILVSQIMLKLISANKQLGKIEEAVTKSKSTPSKDNAITIKGHDDLLVRFSGCCSPVPGDEIIGYISRGRGVCIHRKDCVSLKSLEQVRLIEAEWTSLSANATFSVDIQIVAESRSEIFADITKMVSAEQLPLLAINARRDKNHNAIAIITVEVTNQQQIAHLIERLKSLPSIINVFRTTK
ncbi:MAG: bifunctional (p)ppGpp synthetase/guanosine-3',5'-bis(diphosphate) 3'-pyrophosphohydrolase [Clostridia bacterium]